MNHIYTLHMSARTTNALLRSGIQDVRSLQVLYALSEDFMDIKGIGVNGNAEIMYHLGKLTQEEYGSTK